ncbi:MAG: hypothetical protein ACYTEK_25890, partial [Planctomycetota bacterium]
SQSVRNELPDPSKRRAGQAFWRPDCVYSSSFVANLKKQSQFNSVLRSATSGKEFEKTKPISNGATVHWPQMKLEDSTSGGSQTCSKAAWYAPKSVSRTGTHSEKT